MNISYKLTLFTLFLAFNFNLQAQEGRQSLNFDANWMFKPKEGRYRYNVSGWDKNDKVVNLPHDWSILGDFSPEALSKSNGAYLPYGTISYRKIFKRSELPKTDKIFIDFDGVYLVSDVWINGVWLGTNVNGYMGFRYDITPYLIDDMDNVITVVVKNTPPGIRWYSGTGIYRHVRIVGTNKLHVDYEGTYISTPKVSKKEATAHLETTILNEYPDTKNIEIVATIFEKETNKKVSSNSKKHEINSKETTIVKQDFIIKKPKLWSPDAPSLYIAKTEIKIAGKIVDTYNTKFGVRSFKFDTEKGFSLNGESMKFKGVCLHHDAGCIGAAVPKRLWVRRLALLKEMGCNAIRTSHNPQAPEFMDLCDEMGFMVMDEAFDKFGFPSQDFKPAEVVNIYDAQHKYYEKYLKDDLKRFIKRDRNHPSVILWSIGNELVQQGEVNRGPDMAKTLVDICHELDPYRPVTAGNNRSMSAHLTGFTDVFDVAGYNYAPMFNTYEWEKANSKDRKFIGTESTRGVSTRGSYFFDDKGEIIVKKGSYFSEYENTAFRRIGAEGDWKHTLDRDWFTGVFLWTGFDYLGEPQGKYPNKNGNFGVFDLAGFKKDAFYFYQSVWTDKPMAHILPHWNWKGKEQTIIPVHIYTNGDEAELFLNGQSLGKKKMQDQKDKLHLEWSVKYNPGTLKVITYKNGKKWSEDKVTTTGKPYALAIKSDTNELKADASDAASLEVTIVDKNGNVVPNSNNNIKFSVKGAGKLIGIDNGDPTNVAGFTKKELNAFNGYCLGVVQANFNKGEITISVSSDGLKPATFTIITK